MMMTNSTDRLAELIEQKRHVLAELRGVGEQQSALITQGDTTSLLKLLAVKQQWISTLQRLERELAPFYAEDPNSRTWRSTQDRARCAQAAAECNTLLDEIVQLEKQGAEIMTARRNEVAQQLEQAHAAAQVRSAYWAQR
jgi:flagellar biosynthesis/type III secretory pathway chaperone